MKRGKQIAALPVKWGKSGKIKILMITSRDTGRWLVPKGWTMEGLKPWAAARIEAEEEAGAVGKIGKDVWTTYRYTKKLGAGVLLPVKVDVYPFHVSRLLDDWKEKGQRKRKWFSLSGAAKRISEPELSKYLLSLEKKKAIRNEMRNFLKAS